MTQSTNIANNQLDHIANVEETAVSIGVQQPPAQRIKGQRAFEVACAEGRCRKAGPRSWLEAPCLEASSDEV
ncbi:hypothetical protein [Bradyrhizobium sp. ORS 111]|uniref:hypothetical protein n=1 Tax=Bradyrhizobium sp. ORS 111 TaxID=1685958 RepID=UPI0038905937